VPRGSLWRGVFRAKRDRSDETKGAGEKKRTCRLFFFTGRRRFVARAPVDH
jgi:hypothetical protein